MINMHAKEIDTPEYMLIRQFVIDMIARSGNTPKKIPSTREIAKRFNVSHPTVMKGIKDLVNDKYLVTKKGIGTFTCGTAGVGNDVKIVGMLFGDGKVSLYTKMGWRLISEVGNTLLPLSDKYRLQNCQLSCSLKKTAQTINEAAYDGLIWVSPEDKYLHEIQILKNKFNLPLVVIGRNIEGITSFGWNYRQERYNITSHLLKQGKRNILTVNAGTEEMQNIRIEEVRRAHEDMGIEFNEKMVIPEDAYTVKRLADFLDFGLPIDAIAFTGEIARYYDMLKKKVDNSKCLVVSGELTTYDDMEFKGLLVKRKIKPAVKVAIDNLLEQINSSGSCETINGSIEIEMEYIK